MAPTKNAEKEAKLTPEQGAATILKYLRDTNRPYSASDISSNLKNRVTKAAAQKLLKDMHERREIEGRASGKQLVYHALQEEPEDDLSEQLQKVEQEANRLREDTLALKSEEKELRQLLKDDSVLVSIPQLQTDLDDMEKTRQEQESRLATLRGGSLKPISLEERTKVKKDFGRMKKTLDERFKIRKELWSLLEDSVGKEKAEEVKESLDLSL